MTRLSVNINKVATLRNSRGGDTPNVLKAALSAEAFGAEGITVHPRPDERHIRYADVRELRPAVSTEFNIEGNPTVQSFVDLVLEVRPDQVTMVPDGHGALTSNAGWNTIENRELLTNLCKVFKASGIRTSIFIDPVPETARAAALCGADRIELYTAAYAEGYSRDREAAIAPYVATALAAKEAGLGVNAGHDLSLENLAYFIERIPFTDEVSIGHALISDALYMGLEKTIAAYLLEIRKNS